MENLTRRLHPPEKRGAVLTPQAEIGEQWIQIRSAPWWDEMNARFVMAYLSLRGRSSDTLLAESRDGVTWTRMKFDRPGVEPSNKVLVANALPKFNEPSNIVFDPRDSVPAHRFKALVGGEGRLPAVSADGLSYRLISERVIQSSDESQLVQDRAGGRFVATLKVSNAFGRAVGLATSEDFEHWSNVRLVFGADEEDQHRAHRVIRARIDDARYFPVLVDPEPPVSVAPRRAIATWSADIYDMAVFPYAGLWIGLPAVFYHTALDANKTNTDGFHEIQLTVSHDLTSWQRVADRQPFLAASPTAPAAFDRTQLLPTSRPIEHGDELWFYYTGMKWREPTYNWRPDRTPRPRNEWTPAEIADFDAGSGAVCLAVLRRDGFVSLDAGATSGHIVTQPLTVSADALYLNVSAAKGQATVAVLEEGKPIAGLSDEDCLPCTGDAVAARVRWRGAGLGRLAGKQIQLRVTLRNASLYSLWLGPQSDLR